MLTGTVVAIEVLHLDLLLRQCAVGSKGDCRPRGTTSLNLPSGHARPRFPELLPASDGALQAQVNGATASQRGIPSDTTTLQNEKKDLALENY